MSEPMRTDEYARPSDRVRDTLPGEDDFGMPSGPTVPLGVPGEPPSAVPSDEDVMEALYDVVDPELMVNIVDLGLVYGVEVDEEANVVIDMTLTSPACPLTDQIEWNCAAALEGLASTVSINWVWMPPWTMERITEDGREQLRSIGFNI